MIKLLITDYKKITLWGDCHLEEEGCYFPFRGQAIKVKLLWLFWVNYRSYEVRPNYF